MKSDKCLKGLELQLYLHRPLKSVDQQDSVGVVSRRASGESAVKSFSLGVWEFIIKNKFDIWSRRCNVCCGLAAASWHRPLFKPRSYLQRTFQVPRLFFDRLFLGNFFSYLCQDMLVSDRDVDSLLNILDASRYV